MVLLSWITNAPDPVFCLYPHTAFQVTKFCRTLVFLLIYTTVLEGLSLEIDKWLDKPVMEDKYVMRNSVKVVQS